jgi:hypothetical protein
LQNGADEWYRSGEDSHVLPRIAEHQMGEHVPERPEEL